MNALNLLPAAFAIVAIACNRETSRDATPVDTAVTTSAAATPSASRAIRTGNIGSTYKSLPTGVSYVDGAVLHSGYDLAHVSTPKGDRVWLDTLDGASKTVVAELEVPPLAKDERLFMASCDVGNTLDPDVVAIVVAEPSSTRFTKIRQAWRVDLAAKRFDLIPVAGIVCEEPGS